MSKSKVRLLLYPFAWIYGFIVWIRNQLFNIELLPSENYDLPIISIGNITVGGTGKTPHTEYLIHLLREKYQVAVLSRGYKRKSKGYVLANEQSGVADLGDEPLQMKKKFSDLVVAVDENRREGIRMLMDKTAQPFIDIILLDDAFQHRYVNPSISILLIDYNRMLDEDYLLPAGSLREPAGQIKRADIVIISKCPNDLKPIDIRILTMKISLLPHQTLYYTTMQYGALKAMHPYIAASTTTPHEENLEDTENTDCGRINNDLTMDQIHREQKPVLLVVGIASPKSLIAYVEGYSPQVETLIFPDHHDFNKKDAKKITAAFEKIKASGGVILSTEKDVMRIQNNAFMDALTPHIYYPVLQVHFLEEEGSAFEQKILEYVRINKRNRKLAQK